MNLTLARWLLCPDTQASSPRVSVVVLLVLSLAFPSAFDIGNSGDGQNGDNADDDDSDSGDGDANGKLWNGDGAAADIVCVLVEVSDVDAEGGCDTEHKDADIMPFSVAVTMALGTWYSGGLYDGLLVWVEVETEGREETCEVLADLC